MMSKMIEPITFTVPLSFEAHDIAQQCAEKSSPTKFKQVYLNTLAVYAVDSYLHCMGFETNLEKSESRDSLMLKFVDVADLDVVGVGKIECRPVLPDSQTCHIPSDAWENRICYVAVQLNQSLKAATLLGFTQTATAEVPVADLSQLDDFLGYLSEIKQTQTVKLETNQPEFVDLKKWFEGIFNETWLTVEQLLNPEKIAMMRSFRNVIPIVRGQQIDLGMELAGDSLALIVEIPAQSDSEVEFKVQVHPMGNSLYLPEGLKLMVQDESGETVLIAAESRKLDNFLQLIIRVELGDCFCVNIALGDAIVTKNICFSSQ